MSARATTAWSFSETYCCFSREPSLASRLNLTALAVSVAEYSLTGIDTRPKLRVREAIERAAMNEAPIVRGVNGRPHPAIHAAAVSARHHAKHDIPSGVVVKRRQALSRLDHP